MWLRVACVKGSLAKPLRCMVAPCIVGVRVPPDARCGCAADLVVAPGLRLAAAERDRHGRAGRQGLAGMKLLREHVVPAELARVAARDLAELAVGCGELLADARERAVPELRHHADGRGLRRGGRGRAG